MAWDDRLREASYTSPSGTTYRFTYEDVTRSQDLKNNPFEYPDGDGTYVQANGATGRRYPVAAIFWGEDCDLEAQAFEDALTERGAGVLDHPIYGRIDVLPVGTVERSDRLKTAANQSTVNVTFYETTGVVYPEAGANAAEAVGASINAYNEAAAAGFEEGLEVANVAERTTLGAQWGALIDTVDSSLNTIARAQDAAFSQYEAIKTSIDTSIDVLVGKPLTLAFQAQQLIQTPGRIIASATARLNAYGDLLSSLTGGQPAERGLDNTALNFFVSQDLNAGAAVAGLILSTINSQFQTQSEAIAAADTILAAFDDLTAWRDANYDSLNLIDTGDSYQKLQESVALAAGFAIELSFSLKREQTLTITRPRSIIDLVAELYGALDDETVNFFINSNSLTADEILEVPAGRKVVYYV